MMKQFKDFFFFFFLVEKFKAFKWQQLIVGGI